MKVKKEFAGNSEDYALALRFAKSVKQEAPELIKSVVLFGSAVKSTYEKIYAADIDILIIVNDQLMVLNKEVIAAYRVIVEKIASKVSKRFHINSVKLTEFIDFARNGDPIAINILRDGIPLTDAGFFNPLKKLLEQGKIKPSEENVWVYYMKAPTTIQSAKWHILQGCIDLNWAVVDVAHAALLAIGKVPYYPKQLSRLMSEHIIKRGLMQKKYIDVVDKYSKLADSIVKRKVRQISGKEFDSYQSEVKEFIDEMKRFIIHQHPRMEGGEYTSESGQEL